MKRLLLLLSVPFCTSVCTLIGGNIKISVAPSPTLTPAQTEPSLLVVTMPSSPTLSTQEEYRQVNLFCETYIETRWGNGTGQWGWPDGVDNRPSTLLPLKFDDAGRLYLADYINSRVLRYDKTNRSPMEISLKPLISQTSWPFPFRFSIEIYRDEILVPYGLDNVGILSADTGNPISSIQLPGYHYDPSYPTSIAIGVDKKGRLYVFGKEEYYYAPIQSVFFEPGWEKGKWEKIEVSEDMRHIINPYFGDDYMVSEVYMTDTIVILKLDLDDQTCVPIDTKLPKRWTPALFGVDNHGNAYVTVTRSTPPTWTYAKYSLLTHQTQVGRMQLDASYTMAVPSVAPDGTLYILVYSDQDLGVHPRILRCQFPRE